MLTNDVGFYGKLPFYGDFLRYGKSDQLLEKWETWLQQILHDSQQVNGKDKWLESYLKSPVWNFIINRDAVDDSSYIGLIIPSVDSVGRYYPFMVYAEIFSPEKNMLALGDLHSWLTDIQALMLEVLDVDTYSYQELKQQVINISKNYFSNQIPEKAPGISLEKNMPMVFSHEQQSRHQALTQLHYFSLISNQHQSLWWSDGSDDIQPSSITFDSMPDARFYLAMLDGQWSSYGITPYSLPTQDNKTYTRRQSDQPIESHRTTMTPQLSTHAITHTGHVRERNEDMFLNETHRCLWAVADGMGGHSNGDIASSKMIEALSSTPLSSDLHTAFELLNSSAAHTSKKLFEYSEDTIGTTLAILFISGNKALCAWAGDSRIYRIDNNGVLRQITQDHSVEGEDGYENSMLTRAIGAEENISLDMHIVDINPGDRFFLCSDGVYGELSHGQLATILHHGISAKNTCEEIVTEVLKTPANDNLTAVIVDV